MFGWSVVVPRRFPSADWFYFCQMAIACRALLCGGCGCLFFGLVWAFHEPFCGEFDPGSG
jgi:hypothetical protein